MYVIGVEFINNFLIENIYELLPIVPIANFSFKKGTSLPYFNVDQAIVSVVPKIKNSKSILNMNRGVRTFLDINSPGFGNSVSVDFQTFDKNFNIKISSSKTIQSKFHITGSKSLEMAQEVTNRLLFQIKLTEEAWKPFFRLKKHDKIEFINKILPIVSHNNTLLSYDTILKKLDEYEATFGEFFNCVKLIARYVLEDSQFDMYLNRLNRIVNLDVGSNSIFHTETDIVIKDYDIYNGSYIGNIGYSNLFLTHISIKLIELGYKVSFFNLGKPGLNIVIPIIDSTIVHEKKIKQKVHRFKISINGTVNLNSRGHFNDAITTGMSIINLIRDIVESDSYKNSLCGKIYNNLIHEKDQTDKTDEFFLI